MNISTKIKMLAAVAATFASVASAENIFQQSVDVGGLYPLTNTANWSEGVLPTNSGTINASSDGELTADVTGWTVTQNGSIINANGRTISGSSWTINGGALGNSGTLTVSGSSTITVNDGGSLVGGGNRNLTISDSTVNLAGGTMQAGRDMTIAGSSVVDMDGGTVSAGRTVWAKDQVVLQGSGTFTVQNIQLNTSAQLNLTNSVITASGTFGQRSYKASGGSVTLDGCTLSADLFFVPASGFELTFAGSNEGTATFNNWDTTGKDDPFNDENINIDFGPGTLMSMTLESSARALVFGGVTNTNGWAEALWENNQLLYDGSSSTNLGNLSWADATDSGIGVGTNVYFKFTPDGAYGGTLALAGSALPPAAPAGLAATANDGSVGLEWSDNTEDDLESYSVYRSLTSSSYSNALASNLTSSAYVDNSVANGTTYYYVVTAIKSNGLTSANSVEVSAVPGDYVAPGAPTGLTATAGDASVSLDWTDNPEGDVDGYSVFRSTTSSNYSAALVTGLSSSDYIDNTVTNGTTYYYVVTATDTNSNESAQSAEVSATPTLPTGGYANWLSDNGVANTPENFYEYATDSDPNDGLPSTNNPTFTLSGGTFLYIHPQRSDDTNLTYTVQTTTNLLDSGSWMNIGYTVTGTNVTGGTLDFVTNDIDTARSESFVRLKIEQ